MLKALVAIGPPARNTAAPTLCPLLCYFFLSSFYQNTVVGWKGWIVRSVLVSRGTMYLEDRLFTSRLRWFLLHEGHRKTVALFLWELSVGGLGGKATAFCTNALPVCSRFMLPLFPPPAGRGISVLALGSPVSNSFILAQKVMGLRVWYLPLAKLYKKKKRNWPQLCSLLTPHGGNVITGWRFSAAGVEHQRAFDLWRSRQGM